MSEKDTAIDAEVEEAKEEHKLLTLDAMVSTVCAICEQSLQAALHSAGMDTEERDRVMRNYRSNVKKSFKDLRRSNDG